MTTVFVVDDEREMVDLIALGLKKRGFTVVPFGSGADALAAIPEHDVDVIVTDLNMKGMTGLELCQRVVADRPDIPVIVLTAFGSFETAVGAIRAGAYDFVTKPVEIEALAIAVRRAAEHRALRGEVKRLREVVANTRGRGELIGASPAMQQVYELIDQVSGDRRDRADHRRERHRQGGRRARDPRPLAARGRPVRRDQLRGDPRGAARERAVRPREGRVHRRQAEPPGPVPAGERRHAVPRRDRRDGARRSSRSSCARSRSARCGPVGAEAEVAIDVRLVAATNRDLEEMVEDKRFREDLYYRINVIHIPLPPLRARGGDVLLLAQHFLRHYAAVFDKKVDRAVGGRGRAHAGVRLAGQRARARQLPRARGRARALRGDPGRGPAREDPRVAGAPHATLSGTELPELLTLEEIERRHVLRVLEACDGNRTDAAKMLGLDRKTLYRKLLRWGVGDDS